MPVLLRVISVRRVRVRVVDGSRVRKAIAATLLPIQVRRTVRLRSPVCLHCAR